MRRGILPPSLKLSPPSEMSWAKPQNPMLPPLQNKAGSCWPPPDALNYRWPQAEFQRHTFITALFNTAELSRLDTLEGILDDSIPNAQKTPQLTTVLLQSKEKPAITKKVKIKASSEPPSQSSAPAALKRSLVLSQWLISPFTHLCHPDSFSRDVGLERKEVGTSPAQDVF